MLRETFEPFAPHHIHDRGSSASPPDWSKDEDDLLFQIAALTEEHDWVQFSKWFHNRSPGQLEERWSTAINPFGDRKGWSREEDALLTVLIGQLGTNNWTEVASRITGRTPKQVRDRWDYFLDPSQRNRSFTRTEDITLAKQIAINGTKWKTMSQMMGRTEQSLKNRWMTELERRSPSLLEYAEQSYTDANRTISSESTDSMPKSDFSVDWTLQGNDRSYELDHNPDVDTESTFGWFMDDL